MTWGLYIKLAWRNVLRNKRRTLIAGTAVAVGLAALMFVDALHLSMKQNMIDAATASFLGEGQILHEEYRKSAEIEHTVRELQSVVDSLESDPRVSRFTVRSLAFGMLASPSNTGSIQLVGVDPVSEQHLTEVDERIVEGSYFEGDNRHDIVIGAKLAELLEVELGDRVVVTAAQAYTGQLAQEMFRVSGIYFFNVVELDRYMGFVRLDQAQKMLNLNGGVHQIALKFHDRDLGRRRTDPFWSDYSRQGNEAVGWADLVPQLEKVFRLSKLGRLIIAAILFGVVALGIVNTLFMSLYERLFEFGVMRAVGTRSLSMGRLVVLEACALTVISIALGYVIGAALLGVTSTVGIDFSGIEYEGVTFTKALYPVWHVQQFTLYPVAFLVFAALVALYPAAYAARLTPARAMRKSF